jgi:hypothetical protein
MKKLFAILSLIVSLTACNNEKKEEATITTSDTSVSNEANRMSEMADSASRMMDKMGDSANQMMDKMGDSAKKMMEKAAEKMEEKH